MLLLGMSNESNESNDAGLPFWFRQFIAWGLQSAGIETVPGRESAWPDYFDNTKGIGEVKRKLFYKSNGGVLLPFKGRPKPVLAETKIGIEAHITAVAFGTTKSARKFWLQAIQSGLIPDALLKKYQIEALEKEHGPIEGLELVARRMALHARFWEVPYHYVALLNGDVLFNNDITRYTYHGNGGNALLIGVCLEGNYPGLEKNRKPKHHQYDEFTIETGRAALRLSVSKSRGEGAPCEELYAHRQYSDGRLGDPGEGWWKEIGLPVAKELNLQIRYNFKHGSGNMIPREWDENGLVDYYGRM